MRGADKHTSELSGSLTHGRRQEQKLTRKELEPSRDDRGVRQLVLVLATRCLRKVFRSVKDVFTAT